MIPTLLATLVCAAPPVEPHAQVSPDVDRRLEELGAPVRVWVFLADKGLADPVAEAAALAAAEAALPPRARARRAARRSAPGLVDLRDVPVHAPYVAAVRGAGAAVRRESPWLNAVSATVDADALAGVAALPFVTEVRLVARGVLNAAQPFGPVGGGTDLSQVQLETSGIDALHAQGLTGQGVVIGVLDTGFRLTHQAFLDPLHPLTVLAQKDFVNDDLVVSNEPGDDPFSEVHGTLVLGALAAYQPGSLVGAAYDASYVLCKTEDVTQEVQGEEDDYVAGLQFAELQGADVVTSSIGYIDWHTQATLDGQTTPAALAVNAATANGVVCLTAIGNGGHDGDPATSSMITPSDAFDVLTCGAVGADGSPSPFTSSGPTADGRVKPELVALGEAVGTVDPYDDTKLTTSNGTSLSTPLVAGAAACLLQGNPAWGVPDLRARMIAAADGGGVAVPDPLAVTGYGAADARAAHEDLLLGPPDPGLVGQVNTLRTFGATPWNAVFLGYSLGTGLLPVPGCATAAVDLGALVLVQAAVADGAGEAGFAAAVPAGASGLLVHAQAVELLACRVSARRPIAFP